MAAPRDISDPAQIRSLLLITPRQFGILVGHGETTVEKWIAKGWVRPYTALDTVSVLIRADEVERFLREREDDEATRREAIGRARGRSRRATA